MDVKINKLPKNMVELMVEISSDELKPYLELAVTEISQQVKVDGFRPGKVPYDVLVKRVGAIKIYQEAAQKAVAKTYPQAVTDNELLTVGPPKISLEKIAPDNPVVYKATVALLPKAELGDYKQVRVAKQEVKTEQKDIDETLANLQKMFGKEKRVTRPVKQGDKVEIDLDTHVDNVPIDGGTSKNHPVNIGQGQFIPGFEDNLIGLSENQTKEIKLNFPKEYHRQDLAGRPVEFKVKVNSIFAIEQPALDDDFAKTVGQFASLDELKKQIKQNVFMEKSAKEQQRWELAVLDKIISQSKFDEVPDILLDSEKDKMIHELEHDITNQGMKFDDYLISIKKTADQLKSELLPQATKRVKTALILRKIAAQEKIEINDQEVDKEVDRQKQQYQSNQEILKKIDTDEFKEYTRNMLRSRKVFKIFSHQ